jgi:hypothetical protein
MLIGAWLVVDVKMGIVHAKLLLLDGKITGFDG